MDYQYWNNYYDKDEAPKEPSQFSKDVLSYLEKDKKLIELGCGNGRDAVYFSQNGLNVMAIDQSELSIYNLEKNNHNNKKVKFIADDFIRSNMLKELEYDYVYSRFTMHSITEEEESILLNRVYTTLKKDGLLLIEVRSIKDDIYGLGRKIARNTYVYNDHCRRFVVIDELIEKIKLIGFKIILANQDRGYAVYKDQNPIVIRIIAKK